jgi:general secretion pathway protein C
MATVAQALRFDGELVSQLIARAPQWVTGVLVVLLGVRAALLVAGLVTRPVDTSAQASPQTAVTRTVVDVPSILRANLFGQSAPTPGSANAPLTTMALLLAGVFADQDEKRGFAMLGTSAADVKLYRVGESVPGGARLHAVQVDRVMLDRGGTIEALLIPPRTGAGGSAPLITTSPAASASMERVQQLVRENPAIIGQVIQRQAVLADGKLRGMRVFPGTNAAAFNKLGLRPGDLVTAINGTALDDQTRSNEIFNTLSGAAEARVTVVRNGSQQDLVLNLADVANEAERLTQTPATAPGGRTYESTPASAR